MAIPLVALVVTEGSGNLYLTKVAVRGGRAGAAGVGATARAATVVAGAGSGAAAVGADDAGAAGAAGAATGVGSVAANGVGAKCL